MIGDEDTQSFGNPQVKTSPLAPYYPRIVVLRWVPICLIALWIAYLIMTTFSLVLAITLKLLAAGFVLVLLQKTFRTGGVKG